MEICRHCTVQNVLKRGGAYIRESAYNSGNAVIVLPIQKSIRLVCNYQSVVSLEM